MGKRNGRISDHGEFRLNTGIFVSWLVNFVAIASPAKPSRQDDSGVSSVKVSIKQKVSVKQ
jgi:hypothetical protein